MKSAVGYYDRLATDPGFARQMSERQRCIGQWPRSWPFPETAEDAVDGSVANVQDIASENYAA